MCKSWCEAILGIVIIVLSFVPNSPANWADWVILIAGVVLLVHSFICKSCFNGNMKAKKK